MFRETFPKLPLTLYILQTFCQHQLSLPLYILVITEHKTTQIFVLVLLHIQRHNRSQKNIHTYIPAIHDRNDTSLPISDLHESGLGHVEVGARGIAPPAGVGVFRPVGRAEVGGGHGCEGRPSEAPLRLHTPYLVARPTPVSIVEQRRAQCCCVRPIPTVEQVPITACPPCTYKSCQQSSILGIRPIVYI